MNTKHFKAVIFDFDGVILNSEPIHYQACCLSLKPLGIFISYSDYQAFYLGMADKDMFPKILNQFNIKVTSADIQQLINTKVALYIQLIEQSKELPFINGLEPFLLQTLEHEQKIAICSASTAQEIKPVLSRFNNKKLMAYFKVIVTADDVIKAKPAPEGYLLAAQQLGVAPQDCLVIEDSPHGIEAASKAGMTVTALLTSHQMGSLSKADYVVQDFKGLLLLNAEV